MAVLELAFLYCACDSLELGRISEFGDGSLSRLDFWHHLFGTKTQVIHG